MDFSRPILLDAVTMLEAHELKCWNALASRYQFETVEQCVIETQTGFQHRKPELRIDDKTLRSQLRKVHAVSDAELAVVIEKGGASLDDGEQALWAHALHRQDAWVLCGPDRASMHFGYDNKHRERLISMGELLLHLNVKVKLREHFTKAWLDQVIRNRALGVL